MRPIISLEVNQTLLRGGQCLPRVLLDHALISLQKELRLKRSGDISLAFVTPSTIRSLNRQYRGKDRSTDVLSFEDGEGGGEILLCYPVAARQAKRKGHPTRHELIFLFIHGCLHLFGYDHETPADRKKMFARQRDILTPLGIDPTWELD